MKYLCIEECVCSDTTKENDTHYVRYVKNKSYTFEGLRPILDINPKFITTNFIAISDTDGSVVDYGFEEETFYLCIDTFVDDTSDYMFEKSQIYYCNKDYKLINNNTEINAKLIDITFNRADKFIKLGKPLSLMLKDIERELIIVIALKDVPGHFTKGSFYSMRNEKARNYQCVYDNNGIAYHLDNDSKVRNFCIAYNNDVYDSAKIKTATPVESKPDDKGLYHVLIYICGIKAYHCAVRSLKVAKAIQKYDKYAFIEIKIQRLRVIEDYDYFIKYVIEDKLKLK